MLRKFFRSKSAWSQASPAEMLLRDQCPKLLSDLNSLTADERNVVVQHIKQRQYSAAEGSAVTPHTTTTTARNVRAAGVGMVWVTALAATAGVAGVCAVYDIHRLQLENQSLIASNKQFRTADAAMHVQLHSLQRDVAVAYEGDTRVQSDREAWRAAAQVYQSEVLALQKNTQYLTHNTERLRKEQLALSAKDQELLVANGRDAEELKRQFLAIEGLRTQNQQLTAELNNARIQQPMSLAMYHQTPDPGPPTQAYDDVLKRLQKVAANFDSVSAAFNNPWVVVYKPSAMACALRKEALVKTPETLIRSLETSKEELSKVRKELIAYRSKP